MSTNLFWASWSWSADEALMISNLYTSTVHGFLYPVLGDIDKKRWAISGQRFHAFNKIKQSSCNARLPSLICAVICVEGNAHHPVRELAGSVCVYISSVISVRMAGQVYVFRPGLFVPRLGYI